MIGKSHWKIAELVGAHVAEPWKELLADNWDAVEIGLEIPDRFMIWHRDPGPPASAGKVQAKLVHRFYVDRTDEPKGELIQMILMYTEGIAAFAKDLAADEDLRDQTQDMLLYVGALIHFLSDLCTPMHVGCSLRGQLEGILGKGYHQKLEARFWRRHKNETIDDLLLYPNCTLNESWLMQIATDAHQDYIVLPDALQTENKEQLREIAIRALHRSVATTVLWLDTMATGFALNAALAKITNADATRR